jgi:hypothetical protein
VQLLPAPPARDDEARLFADAQVLRDPEAGELTCRSPASKPGRAGIPWPRIPVAGGALLVRTADFVDSDESVSFAGFILHEDITSVHEDGEAEKPVPGGSENASAIPLPVHDIAIYFTRTSRTDPRSPLGPSDVRRRDS